MTGRVAVVLVVPHGTHRPEPIAEALHAHHPTWAVGAAWCGDPHLRPPLIGLTWFYDHPTSAAAEIAVVSGDVRVGEWKRALQTRASLLVDESLQVVLLWVGATAVLSAIDELVEAGPEAMTFLVRAAEALPDYCLAPSEADLIAAGAYSTTSAVFGPRSRPAVEWLLAHLDGRAEVGHLLSRAAQLFGANEC
ncbi:MAG: hypothetical protein ACXVKJ_19065, partial [Ilumatobacteraceae bacterium]